MGLKKIEIIICDDCLNGIGDECHTPGCALFLHRIDLKVPKELYRVIEIMPDKKPECAKDPTCSVAGHGGGCDDYCRNICSDYSPVVEDGVVKAKTEHGSISVNLDRNAKPAMVKPPLGIEPRRFHRERRFHELKRAIERYQNAGRPVPSEWADEYNELFDAYGKCRVVLSVDRQNLQKIQAVKKAVEEYVGLSLLDNYSANIRAMTRCLNKIIEILDMFKTIKKR